MQMKARFSFFRRILRFFKWVILLFFSSTILAVVLFRFVPVPVTPLMVIRCVQQVKNGEDITLHHEWVPLEKMSPYMPMAVMASEDQRFLIHHGVDPVAIKQAQKDNKKRKRPRGGSTITQQTAKNVFLWPNSNWVRKGLETYFTVLIELFWSKERIMEVYLNSIEMGKGIYGVKAVARHNFNKQPSELTKADCALIAATLPNPLKRNSKHPSAWLLKRQKQIVRQMRNIPSFPQQ